MVRVPMGEESSRGGGEWLRSTAHFAVLAARRGGEERRGVGRDDLHREARCGVLGGRFRGYRFAVTHGYRSPSLCDEGVSVGDGYASCRNTGSELPVAHGGLEQTQCPDLINTCPHSTFLLGSILDQIAARSRGAGEREDVGRVDLVIEDGVADDAGGDEG